MGIAPSEFEEAYEDEQTIRGAILTGSIRGLEPREPTCVRPHTSIRDTIEAMNDARVGCVLVTQGDRLVGILTERDILKKVIGKFELDNQVERFMTKHPETVGMDDGIAYALHKMHVGGYRHIPVVDNEGRPVGVVSVRDLLKFIVSLFPAAVLNVPPEPRLAARALDGG